MTAGFEALLRKLVDPDSTIPLADLSELSDLERSDLRRLEDAWHVCSDDRRRRILVQLGELAEEHIELFFEDVNRMALADVDPRVRQSAIQNLWECELPELGDALVAMLQSDPSAAVRAEAASALGRFVYLGEMQKIPEELHSRIEQALFELIAEEEAGEPRLRALESIGHSSQAEAARRIGAAYASEDADLRRAAIVAMGRTYDPRWLEQVERELESPDPDTRAEAARASGELEATRVVPQLIELLDDGSERVRAAAIWSLGQIGGEPARVALTRLMRQDLAPAESRLIDDALDHISFLETTPDLGRFEPD